MFDLEGAKRELKWKLENANIYGVDEFLRGQYEELIDGVEIENIIDLLKVLEWLILNELEEHIYDSEIYDLINDTVIKGLLHIIDTLREDSFEFARKLSLNKQ